jgi:uncharacterized cupredoxin-like copper-binding protein
MKKQYIVSSALLLLIAALVLAACGGAAAGGGQGAGQLKVTMTEFKFTPDVFSATAGSNVSLSLLNSGSVQHTFVILKAGTTATSPFDDSQKPNIYWSVSVDPGQTVNTSFTAPDQAGDYQIVCDLPGHLEGGMVAKLTVTK